MVVLIQNACAGESRRCVETLPSQTIVLDRTWSQHGATTSRVAIAPTRGEDLLFWISETGVNVEIEIDDVAGKAITRAAGPVDRLGPRYAYIRSSDRQVATILIKTTEPAIQVGSVHLRVMSRLQQQGSHWTDCVSALRNFAAAQEFYAKGRAISLADIPNTAVDSRTSRGAVPRRAGGTPQIAGQVPTDRETPTAQESYRSAVHLYQTALEGLSAPEHRADRADAQLALAALDYYDLQDWSGSEAWAAEAGRTFTELGEAYAAARAQAIRAAAWMELATRSASTNLRAGAPQPARTQLDQARALLRQLGQFHAERGEPYDEALQINNTGVAYIYEARFERAIPYLTRAQAAFESLGDFSMAATALQNLAICQWGLGRLSEAVGEFDRALQVMRPVPHPHLYLLTLNNSGLAHYAAGQFDTALQLQDQALDFATLTQSDRERARTYYGMGVTYYAIGDLPLATQFLNSALDIGTAELDARNRVATLRALAVIEREQGQLARALAHNSEALGLATAPTARARILVQLAQNHAALGQITQALDIVNTLLGTPSAGDQLVRALALAQRGRLRHASGSMHQAQADLRSALEIFESLDSLADRFETQVELSRVEADLGDRALALRTVRRALGLSAELRAQTANPEYRASIVKALRPALEFEIELLRQRYEAAMRSNDTASMQRWAIESLYAVDESRAQEFESWRSQHLEGVGDRKVAQLLGASTTLYREMAERRFQLATREDRVGVEDPRAQRIRADIARLRVQLGVVNAELARRSSGVSVGSGVMLPAEGPWHTRLPADHLFVEYWLDEQHAYAWTVSGSGVEWISLGSAADINERARDLHERLRSMGLSEPGPHLSDCEELYRRLIAPLGEKLASTHYLTLVPDGTLHYIPFAALKNPAPIQRPYLAQQTVILMAPALRLLATNSLRGRTSSRRALPVDDDRMLLVADAVYTADDPRLQALAGVTDTPQDSKISRSSPYGGMILRTASGSDEFARLPATGREAERIRSDYGAWRVDLLGGLDATRDALLSRDFSNYRFIHIAVHGVIDAEIPQLSALVLGRYGRAGPVGDPAVRAGDLLTKTFRAQAVVLSACDSALGKEFVGEGLIGLRYAALARGAHAVVASLWPVSDGIAADLMTEMYRQIAANDSRRQPAWRGTGSENVAHSLTAAMRKVLEQTPGLDPAIWAPFGVYVAGE